MRTVDVGDDGRDRISVGELRGGSARSRISRRRVEEDDCVLELFLFECGHLVAIALTHKQMCFVDAASSAATYDSTSSHIDVNKGTR